VGKWVPIYFTVGVDDEWNGCVIFEFNDTIMSSLYYTKNISKWRRSVSLYQSPMFHNIYFDIAIKVTNFTIENIVLIISTNIIFKRKEKSSIKKNLIRNAN